MQAHTCQQGSRAGSGRAVLLKSCGRHPTGLPQCMHARRHACTAAAWAQLTERVGWRCPAPLPPACAQSICPLLPHALQAQQQLLLPVVPWRRCCRCFAAAGAAAARPAVSGLLRGCWGRAPPLAAAGRRLRQTTEQDTVSGRQGAQPSSAEWAHTRSDMHITMRFLTLQLGERASHDLARAVVGAVEDVCSRANSLF